MIQTARSLTCGLLLLAVSPVVEAGPREPVAIVYQVSGEASRGKSAEPARLFDHLPAGEVLELKPGARIALAFVTGRRYEIRGPARATLGKEDLAARSGDIRSLPSVPPLPRLAAIAEDERPGPKSGAIRIREKQIEGLYPGGGATALAGELILRFPQIEGAKRYAVELEDGKGAVIYSVTTASTAVRLPAGAVRPSGCYRWSVRAVDRSGAQVHGEAEFITLSAETARARGKLRQLARKSGNGEMMALLAGVDRDLGLLAEARAELWAALRLAPGDAELASALNDLEKAMEGDLAPET